MLLFVRLLVPTVVGGAMGGAAMMGLVASQTSAPDANPAIEPVLTYGDVN